jgi:hypothetical protein
MPVRPQEIFRTLKVMMPIETAAELLETSVGELTQSIESGKNKRLRLLELSDGKYVLTGQSGVP